MIVKGWAFPVEDDGFEGCVYVTSDTAVWFNTRALKLIREEDQLHCWGMYPMMYPNLSKTYIHKPGTSVPFEQMIY